MNLAPLGSKVSATENIDTPVSAIITEFGGRKSLTRSKKYSSLSFFPCNKGRMGRGRKGEGGGGEEGERERERGRRRGKSRIVRQIQHKGIQRIKQVMPFQMNACWLHFHCIWQACAHTFKKSAAEFHVGRKNPYPWMAGLMLRLALSFLGTLSFNFSMNTDRGILSKLWYLMLTLSCVAVMSLLAFKSAENPEDTKSGEGFKRIQSAMRS